MGSFIKRERFWSESMTKNVLTMYAGGLACNTLDKSKFYDVMRYAKDALKKSIGEVGEPNSTNKLLFDQVRLIIISHDGYILCTCGGAQSSLMP